MRIFAIVITSVSTTKKDLIFNSIKIQSMRKIFILFWMFTMYICVHCNAQEYIQMKKEASGIYTIPCEVNGLKLRFILDTGASSVVLSLAEATFMIKNGYLTADDFIGMSNAVLADGSISKNAVVKLKEIKVGSLTIKDVRAAIVDNINAPLLLGQSVLSRVGRWSVDGTQLILQDIKSSENANWAKVETKAKEYLDALDAASALSIIRPFMKAGNRSALLMYVENLCVISTMNDPEETYSVEQARKLAEKRDVDACMALGIYYNRKNDYGNAELYYSKTIGSEKYAQACYEIACMYHMDLSNKEKALEWYKKAADNGLATAAEMCADIYKEQKKYQLAISYLNKAISLGSGEARMILADMYLNGDGVVKDVTKGISLLSNSKDCYGLIKLTEYYFFGTYVKKNITKAKEYLYKIPLKNQHCRCIKNFLNGFIDNHERSYNSARISLESALREIDGAGSIRQQYITNAYLILGTYYQKGKGVVNKQASVAYEYFIKAAEEGEPCAYGYLGDLLIDDSIVDVDYNEAFSFYKQGAENDDPYCCYKVGVFYEHGIAVEKDLVQSRKWKAKAKSLGYDENN